MCRRTSTITKRARHKDDLAQSMSTGEMTLKHTNLCLVVSSRSSSQAPPEVTLLPSTFAQCYLNFSILPSSVVSRFFFL